MFSKKEKYNALNRVLNSKTLKKSTTTNVLLKHLFEATIQEKQVNTNSIGFELFGKKYNPEKSDVNIRVNISHLRKRLKHYYENEGLNDSIILAIEPGQYNITFSKRKKNNSRKNKIRLIVAFFLLAIVCTSFFLLIPKNKNQVWKPLFNNNLETTLYLGDVFGYSGPTEFGFYGWHRVFTVNSEEDFYKLTSKNPEKYANLKPANYSYVVFENSYNIKPFTQYFTKEDYNFTIRPTSKFKTRSIKDRNSIYAGPIFVKSGFTELFNDFSKNIKFDFSEKTTNPVSLKFKVHLINKKNIQLNLSKDGEYAIASSFKGANNSRHYMFFSNHGMGLTAVVEYFTNPKSIHEFSEKYLSNSDEFTAIFFVKGKDRTSLSMELVFFDDNK